MCGAATKQKQKLAPTKHNRLSRAHRHAADLAARPRDGLRPRGRKRGAKGRPSPLTGQRGADAGTPPSCQKAFSSLLASPLFANLGMCRRDALGERNARPSLACPPTRAALRRCRWHPLACSSEPTPTSSAKRSWLLMWRACAQSCLNESTRTSPVASGATTATSRTGRSRCHVQTIGRPLKEEARGALAEIAKKLVDHGADPVPALQIAESRCGPYRGADDEDTWEAWHIVAAAAASLRCRRCNCL